MDWPEKIALYWRLMDWPKGRPILEVDGLVKGRPILEADRPT